MWLDTPREGFTARCIDYFGVGFDTDKSVVRSTSIPDTTRRKGHRVAHYEHTDPARRHAGRRGGQASSATVRVQRGKALL